jgi:hypothetical protein
MMPQHQAKTETPQGVAGAVSQRPKIMDLTPPRKNGGMPALVFGGRIVAEEDRTPGEHVSGVMADSKCKTGGCYRSTAFIPREFVAGLSDSIDRYL